MVGMCNRWTMRVVCLLSLLWSLVEVHSQTFPYVSFNGQTLANHSYVDLSLVGDASSGSDSVQCHTDMGTCCSGLQGHHRGDWYGTRLLHPGSGDIYESRLSQRVDLRRRNNANSPTGIYRCDIPTNAVHDDTDISVRDTVYVGLYTGSGGKCSYFEIWWLKSTKATICKPYSGTSLIRTLLKRNTCLIHFWRSPGVHINEVRHYCL